MLTLYRSLPPEVQAVVATAPGVLLTFALPDWPPLLCSLPPLVMLGGAIVGWFAGTLRG